MGSDRGVFEGGKKLMGVYIKGMEMPKDRPQLLWVYPSGKALTVQSDVDPWKELQAVPVPPHGRLGDLDAFTSRFDKGVQTVSLLSLPAEFKALYSQLANEMIDEIKKCPTVIPAEEGEL